MTPALDVSYAPYGATSDALYSGGGLADPSILPHFLQVAIGTHAYVVNLREKDGLPGYKRSTIPALRQPVDQSTEPGETSLNSEGLWRRAQDDWSLGAGQEHLDDRASTFSMFVRSGEGQSLRSRFWRAHGIDPWTIGQLKLQKATTLSLASTQSNLYMTVANNLLYTCDGTNVRWTADGVTWTTLTGGPGANARGITTDGTTVWISFGASGIYSTTQGTATMASFNPQVAYFILYANGRLICGNGTNSLLEIPRSGAAIQIGATPTFPNPNTVIQCGTGSPDAIYVGINCGDRATFFAITNIAATGTLGTPTYAGELPTGETINALSYYDGKVIAATSVGIRECRLTGATSTSVSLVHGPAIPVSPLGATALDMRGQFCWFGWGSYTTFDTTTSYSGLGRADLSRDTFPFTPAYATDLMTPTALGGAVQSVCYFAGLHAFSVLGSGVFLESPTAYVPSAVIDSGWIRYGTTERKVITAIDVRHDPLPTGASVGMALYNEDASVTQLATSATAGSLGPAEPYTANVGVAERTQVRLTLKPGTGNTSTPVLRRYTLKALVTPRRMDEIVAPLMVSTKVRTIEEEGTDVYYDTLAEYQYLKGLCDDGTIVRYQEGTSSYPVWVDRVEVVPHDWNDERSFFDGCVLVRMLTVTG